MKTKFFSSGLLLTFLLFISVLVSCSKDEVITKNASVRLKASCGTCNWYGTSYPVCCNTTSGWGWENNASCVAKATCTGAGQTYNSGGGTSSSGSCPSSLSCPSGISCGCYTVSGLGANKQALKNAGATQYQMASAMLETELMNTNYTYGDGKTGSGFNAGREKMNQWEADQAGVGRGSNSAFWNYCVPASGDVSTWNAVKSHWGSLYWAVHRDGQSGQSNPNTTDINNFKSANDWTNNQIGSHLTDDVRFWASLPAI
jgi:hypothetical protein